MMGNNRSGGRRGRAFGTGAGRADAEAEVACGEGGIGSLLPPGILRDRMVMGMNFFEGSQDTAFLWQEDGAGCAGIKFAYV